MNFHSFCIAVVLFLLVTSAKGEDRPPAPLSPEQQLIQAAFDLDVERVKC